MYSSTTRIPVKSPDLATALLSLGYTITPQETYHEKEGVVHRTFFLDDPRQQPEAQRLLTQWAGRDPRTALAVVEPEHPLCAAMYALEALRTLRAWWADPQAVPCYARTPGRLCRLVPAAGAPAAANLLPPFWGSGSSEAKPLGPVRDLVAQVGLMICGFPPYPRMKPPDAFAAQAGGVPAEAPEVPGLFFPAASLTFPGLMGHHLRPPAAGQLRTDFPPGYAPGEHPYEYAAMATANALAGMAAVEAAAVQHRSIFFRGRGQTGAQVSASLFHHKNSSFRDRLVTHLH